MMQSIPYYRGLMTAFSGGNLTFELYMDIVGVGHRRLGKRITGQAGVRDGRSAGKHSIHSKWLFRESGKESVVHINSLTDKLDGHQAELTDKIDTLGSQIALLTGSIEGLVAAIPAAHRADVDGTSPACDSQVVIAAAEENTRS
jgi:hypothetical protein